MTTGMLQSIMLDLCWCEESQFVKLFLKKCRHTVSVSQNFTTLLDMPRIIAFPDLTNWIYSHAERIWSLPKFPQPFQLHLTGKLRAHEFKDNQVMTILLALILMKGAPSFSLWTCCLPNIPLWCAQLILTIYKPNTLTLSYPMFMLSNRCAYISVTGKRLLMLQNFPHLISCQHFWTLFSNTPLHFPT